jgi:hypothetical protein
MVVEVKTFWIAVVLTAVVAFTGGVVVTSRHYESGAVYYGAAKYVCDERTGDTKFTWCGNTTR